MAFTRNPAVGFPATYTGTNEVDALVLIDQASRVTIQGLDANDSVIVSGAALQNAALSEFKIFGNDGSDTISVTSFNTLSSSLIQGGNGGDFISVTNLVVGSTIRGGADGDTIQVSSLSSSTVNGNKGSDSLSVTGVMSNARVFGGSENDFIDLNNVSLRNSRVNGSDGADLVRVDNGTSMVNSTAFGGAGNDTIQVITDFSVSVSGDNGNDIIDVFGDGDNSIVTGEGNDAITVFAFADGSNTIDASTGADTVFFDPFFTAGSNTIVFDRGDSVASTANTVTGNAFLIDGLTVTFGNGVDKITGFNFFEDAVDVDINISAFVNLNGDATTDILSSTGVFEIFGDLAGNTFTVDAATPTHFLYIVAGANQTIANDLASTSNIFISDTQLFAGDFV